MAVSRNIKQPKVKGAQKKNGRKKEHGFSQQCYLETVWVAHCKQLCLDVLLTNTDRLYEYTGEPARPRESKAFQQFLFFCVRAGRHVVSFLRHTSIGSQWPLFLFSLEFLKFSGSCGAHWMDL